MLSRCRSAAGVTVVVAALVAGGCTERSLDESVRDITPPSTVPSSTLPGDPTTTSTVPGNGFVARIAGVDTADLTLGAEFNAQFLRLQFLAVGLDATEAACAADRVVAAAGEDFGSRPVSAVLSGAGITPDVLLPCVPAERMQALAGSGAGADLGKVPVDVLRSTLTELASAGYESVGLTPVEATCLADRVVGTYSDADLEGLMTSLSLPADRAVTALPNCVTSERANELGG